jgi:hypothetical protein
MSSAGAHRLDPSSRRRDKSQPTAVNAWLEARIDVFARERDGQVQLPCAAQFFQQTRDGVGPEHLVHMRRRQRIRIDFEHRHFGDVLQALEDEQQLALQVAPVVVSDCFLRPHHRLDDGRQLRHDLHLREIKDALGLVVDRRDQQLQVLDSHRIGPQRIAQSPVVEDQVGVREERFRPRQSCAHVRPGLPQRERQLWRRFNLRADSRVGQNAEHRGGAPDARVRQVVHRRAEDRQLRQCVAHGRVAPVFGQAGGQRVPGTMRRRQRQQRRSLRKESAARGEETEILVPKLGVRALCAIEDVATGNRRIECVGRH